MNAGEPLSHTFFDESYAKRFGELAATLASGEMILARRLAEAIANAGSLDTSKRNASSLRRWAAVFSRDSYTCRYCLRRTIAPPVLRVVSHAFPDVFKFHRNWKTSETDAAYFVLSTSADHVIPVTRGGTDEPDNLVTACWMCNAMKSNFLLSELPGWILKDVAPDSWRGLTECLDRMIAGVGGLENDSYLRRWSVAIRNPEQLLSVS